MANSEHARKSAMAGPTWAPFALGFRPFFLLAALAAVAAMAVWPFVWTGRLAVPAHYDPVSWHAHEMLFGYAAAVIAGFLLTAVRNWTGVQTWTGHRLALLVAVWLLGRLAAWIPGTPAWLLITLDVAFLPLVAVSLIRPLWQGQNRVNRVFMPLLLAMGLVNLLSHLQMLGLLGAIGDARRVMLELVLVVIVLVGGRVMPFFTQNVLPGFVVKQRPWVEQSTMVSVLLVVAAELVPAVPVEARAVLWGLFGVLQAIRLAGWFDLRVFRMPVLWVLHVGYAWLIAGALLNGLALLGLFPPAAALHALTVGGIGVFTLGMMARVSRGHTGRPIDVSRPTAAAFVLLNLAVVVRVFAAAWLPSGYAWWIDLSAAMWAAAFGLFVWQYAGMLLRPRADGRPG